MRISLTNQKVAAVVEHAEFGNERERLRRYALALMVAASFAGQFFAEFSKTSENRFADLQVYVGAAKSMVAHEGLYSYRRFNGDVFTYPPAAADLMIWLAWFPVRFGELAWGLLEIAAYCVAATALVKGLGRSGSSASWRRFRSEGTLLIILILIWTAPGRSNIAFGQLSALVFAAVLADMFLVPPRWRGVLLGLSIALKLTPGLFVPFLWLIGDRRSAMRSVVTAVSVTIVAGILDPVASREYWFESVTDRTKFANAWHLGNQSIMAGLHRAGVARADYVWIILSVLIVVASLWAAVVAYRAIQPVLAIGLVGTCSVLVSPISWTHHQSWLVVIGIWALARPERYFKFWGTLIVLLMTITIPHGSGRMWAWLDYQRLALAIAMIAATCAVYARGCDWRYRKQRARSAPLS